MKILEICHIDAIPHYVSQEIYKTLLIVSIVPIGGNWGYSSQYNSEIKSFGFYYRNINIFGDTAKEVYEGVKK